MEPREESENLWLDEDPAKGESEPRPSRPKWFSPLTWRPAVFVSGLGIAIAAAFFGGAATERWMIRAPEVHALLAASPDNLGQNDAFVESTGDPNGLNIGADSSTVPSENYMVVDIRGDVHHPGVYHLPEGARVQDAVLAAGGFVHPADANMVNQAAPVEDGSEVVIQQVGRVPSTPPISRQGVAAESPSAAMTDPDAVNPTETFAPSTGTQKIDLNTATMETLETLPGIGPKRAEAILSYRSAHGGFQSVSELQNVQGIGPILYARMAPYVIVTLGSSP